jgi:lycopene beta-cyclase
MSNSTDLIIVGGGLAGGITALVIKAMTPERKVTLLEKNAILGGLRTWSFHESDISPEAYEILKPMLTKSWTETQVVFPRRERTMNGNYHVIRSEDFHKYVSSVLGTDLKLNTSVTKLSDTGVTLEKGKTLEAATILDARGFDDLPSSQTNGYQKYIGFDFVLDPSTPHGLTTPVLMDATCPQLDGFRFFRLLPISNDRIFIAETFYSDTSDLNEERITKSIKSYVERRGWKAKKVDRMEKGVMPMPLTSDAIKTSVTGEALLIGVRGGYFHSLSGETLPDAVRFAEHLAKIPDLTTTSARESLMRFRRPWLSRQRFYRLVNRLMFHASEPTLRYQVLQKFYELPDDMISRFNSGRSTWSDRFRIMTGKSPMPLKRAFRHFSERSVHDRQF